MRTLGSGKENVSAAIGLEKISLALSLLLPFPDFDWMKNLRMFMTASVVRLGINSGKLNDAT